MRRPRPATLHQPAAPVADLATAYGAREATANLLKNYRGRRTIRVHIEFVDRAVLVVVDVTPCEGLLANYS